MGDVSFDAFVPLRSHIDTLEPYIGLSTKNLQQKYQFLPNKRDKVEIILFWHLSENQRVKTNAIILQESL